MNKYYLRFSILAICCYFLAGTLVAESPAVRIKDIATIFGARDNQLVGFGLVVGLKGTGDSKSVFTRKALTNLLNKLGISRDSAGYQSRNVAAVMVTAELPPFVKPGQRIDLVISSIGEATSLKGGTLVQTPIQGADGETYAIGQGAVVINVPTDYREKKENVETVGRIPQGAIVEKEVAVDLVNKNTIKILINKPDFTTALRLATALDRGGYSGAKALDASTIVLPLTVDDKENMVGFISQLEDFMVVPDAVAKIVIDRKTGTIVIGENVRLAPVAISHADFEIKIGNGTTGEEANTAGGTETTAGAEANGTGAATTSQNSVAKAKLVQLDSGANLSSLVKALNNVGASPSDLIAILQSLKAAGALSAEIEVI